MDRRVPVVIVVAAGVGADDAARTILARWSNGSSPEVPLYEQRQVHVVVVPANVRDWYQLALIDETYLAGTVWGGPRESDMIDLASAREHVNFEAQWLVSDVLQTLHEAGLPATGQVSRRAALWQAARLATAESSTAAVAVVSPPSLVWLRTAGARLMVRLRTPTGRWLVVWPVLCCGRVLRQQAISLGRCPSPPVPPEAGTRAPPARDPRR